MEFLVYDSNLCWECNYFSFFISLDVRIQIHCYYWDVKFSFEWFSRFNNVCHPFCWLFNQSDVEWVRGVFIRATIQATNEWKKKITSKEPNNVDLRLRLLLRERKSKQSPFYAFLFPLSVKRVAKNQFYSIEMSLKVGKWQQQSPRNDDSRKRK